MLDLKSRRSTPIPISVPTDALARRPARVVVAPSLIEYFALSPKGERALFVGRGDVFSAPIEKGPTRNLTRSSDAHDREAVWSPDGAKVAFLSDRSGEEEIYLVSQDGSGSPEKLTEDGKRRRQNLAWSPDGKRIAFGDSTGRIYSVDVASKAVVEVARDLGGNVSDYTWSGDGGWLAFSLADPSGFRSTPSWLSGWGEDQPRARSRSTCGTSGRRS